MTVYWRAFPWDHRAEPGAPFSPSHVPAPTGRGRFDLPVDRSGVLYLAESAEHAIAELLQPWRNSPLRSPHLYRGGCGLALVSVTLEEAEAGTPLDLCDPNELIRIDARPDEVASTHRERTQRIAQRSWVAGHPGLRWWSVFGGDWHGVALFEARVENALTFADPEFLTLESPPVRAAAMFLGMDVS